ncbi:HIRAN domain-containing protein [Paenibacillus sp. SN-8-1]|uniref:HIRAN domain-containing protein n=1 Tax=Paenibacillus sp. SN-8-1 TaxID=3435409 RepID=UPI003D9A465D
MNEKRLKPIVMEYVLMQYAKEYYSFHMKTNAWDSVRYYLENIPELFSFHEVLLRDVPVSKHFVIINKEAENEMEKIFAYQKVEFIKHEHVIPDGRTICIYIVYLENPRDYTLDTDPVRQSWIIAEDAGIRVGFHRYPTQEDILGGVVRLGLYRSFPIEKENHYGDSSSANGGFREDLGAGFKSAWEANIARLLNHKGIEWAYEKKFIQTVHGAYIPDFNVIANDRAYNIEVKGFWDDRSIKKTASARTQEESEGEVIIIDSDLYGLLCAAYEIVIPHWEKSLVSSKSQRIPVVGINVGSRLKAIQSLNEGDALQLVREPENPFDKNAIMVYTKDGREIGFMAKDWASIFAYKMDIGFSYALTLDKVEVEKKVVYIQVKTMPASVELLNGIPVF